MTAPTRTHDDRATMARQAIAEQAAIRLLDVATPEQTLAVLARTPGRRSIELRAAVIRLTAPVTK